MNDQPASFYARYIGGDDTPQQPSQPDSEAGPADADTQQPVSGDEAPAPEAADETPAEADKSADRPTPEVTAEPEEPAGHGDTEHTVIIDPLSVDLATPDPGAAAPSAPAVAARQESAPVPPPTVGLSPSQIRPAGPNRVGPHPGGPNPAGPHPAGPNPAGPNRAPLPHWLPGAPGPGRPPQPPAPPQQAGRPGDPPRPWPQYPPPPQQPGQPPQRPPHPQQHTPQLPPLPNPVYPGPQQQPDLGASAGPMRANIREADLVRPHKPAPTMGWRKVLHRSTRVNVGLSPAERRWNDLRQRVSRNLRGSYLVAVMQEKGGVGKTTATIGVGSALARYRDDKVVAIDANPASGNLSRRIDEMSQGTWRGLITDQRLNTYSDYRHYLGRSTSSGLEVLASDPGDRVITGGELAELWHRLLRVYPIGLIDCGTQMRDDVVRAVLSMVDAVVVVSTTRLDGASSAAGTLNWLIEHGYPHLVRNAVVVISDVSKVSATSSVKKLHEQFERAVRAVHYVPYDPHLSDASAIDFDRLRPQPRRAFIEAAASLVDGFAGAADKDPGAFADPRQEGHPR